MLWLIVIILAYFLFAICILIDKYLLMGHIPNPKVYAFYAGILGILALVLIPFIKFTIPDFSQLLLNFLAGAIFIFAIFGLYTALKKFEPSRIVPAIGGILPLFTLFLVYLFSGGEKKLNYFQILALVLLVFGSVLIVFEKEKSITLASFRISLISAFLFALSFVLFKFIYLAQSFWSGFILMRIGGFLVGLFFLCSKEVREELFKKQVSFRPKITGIFLTSQGLGALASILQNWAIALVPLGLLAFTNALEGTKYVFLLIFTVLFSHRFPQFLKEKISRGVIFQKIIAILLIGAGLFLLAFNQ